MPSLLPRVCMGLGGGGGGRRFFLSFTHRFITGAHISQYSKAPEVNSNSRGVCVCGGGGGVESRTSISGRGRAVG